METSNGVINENEIAEILRDLYSLEPSLKQRESEIRQIINRLIAIKPDAVFDEQFKNKLRTELLTKAQNTNFKQKNNLINNFMENMNAKALLGAGLVVVLLVVGSFYAGKNGGLQPGGDGPSAGDEVAIGNAPIGSEQQVRAISQVKQFESEDDFKKYLSLADNTSYSMGGRGGGGFGGDVALGLPMAPDKSIAQSPAPSQEGAGGATFDRSSQTNVQVVGIDEPDIVKTDGKNLFISTQNYYGIMERPIMIDDGGVMFDKIAESPIYYPPTQTTQIISALPPEAIKKIGKIDKQGDMLLEGNTLVIFNYDAVYGFDISNKENPKEIWKIKYENNSYLNTARMYKGKLYLVTSTYPNYDNPCPIMPLSASNGNITVPCREIYHPIVPASDMTVYSAIKINPTDGKAEDKLSFVGSSGQAIVYMSENALYLSYTYMEDQLKIMLSFVKNEGKGVFPDSLVQRLEKVNSYDISQAAKLTEMQQILQKHMSSMGSDDQVKFQNDLQNKISDYLTAHKRELQFTGIAKFALDKFEIVGTGNVPGTPLNQFSMDEHEGNLRIATTIGQNGFWFVWGWGGAGGDESVSDVYVLDGSLKQLGKATDLGKGERIYSTRFIGDKGYVVTFKQIDPFYVLDLSNPKSPAVKGELKIPGFSSYLHPLADNLILGIGQEDSRVKLSLFDVSNPSDPKEVDKYSLNEYWSEASNNHHAFLQDSKHSVFFLPGGSSGYIFSYSGNKLNLQKAVSDISAQRALYINDAMYIVGGGKVIVISENTWERIGELSF